VSPRNIEKLISQTINHGSSLFWKGFAHFLVKEETDTIYLDKIIFVLYEKLSFSCFFENTRHLFSTNELEELGIQE